MPVSPYTESLLLPDGTILSFEMILVQGGAFDMGANEGDPDAWDREKPRHKVEQDTFYIGKYPVTQALWTAVMGDNPSRFKGPDRPVERVSWHDTQAFIQKLNALKGWGYRLPTEAEWEYAARGGRGRHQYAGSDKLKEVGWYDAISHGETKAVGQKDANELGLYDMSGNVYEWCEDWLGEKYYAECHKKGTVKNPKGPGSGEYRVLRGGSWLNSPRLCRVSSRYSYDPGVLDGTVGFRLVLPSIQLE